MYKSCNLVANICVYASTDANQPIAIVIPHEVHLRAALASQKSVDGLRDLAALCGDDAIKLLVLKECNAVAKKNGFKGTEILQAVVLTPDEWTPESGLVTAAQKIQRAKIAKLFEAEIKVTFFLLNVRPFVVDANVFFFFAFF